VFVPAVNDGDLPNRQMTFSKRMITVLVPKFRIPKIASRSLKPARNKILAPLRSVVPPVVSDDLT